MGCWGQLVHFSHRAARSRDKGKRKRFEKGDRWPRQQEKKATRAQEVLHIDLLVRSDWRLLTQLPPLTP